MADTKAAAEEAVTTSPAEGTKVAGTENQTEAVAVAETEKPEGKKDESANAEKNEQSSKATNGDNHENNGDTDEPRRKDDRRERNAQRNRDRAPNRPRHRDTGYRYTRANQNEFEDLTETDDPVLIRNQIEFYFTDHNLQTDQHMFLEMGGPKNRPISLKHMTTFKRMRRFKPYSAVVAAIRDSETLDLVEDGDFSGAGNEGVKRKTPIVIPERDGDEESAPSTEELFHRFKRTGSHHLDASIYAKNFGVEDDGGQIEIENFFKPYGSVVVRKRRNDDGSWKGSVFVQFDTVQSKEDFLALDPIPKFNGNELYVQDKKAYNEMKCKEKGIDPADWNKSSPENGRSGGRGRGHGRSRGGDRNGHKGGRGRYNDRDRSSRYDNRRRNRSRSRSPRRRRDRDGSRSRSRSPDSRDWNSRRDKFQKGGYKDDRRDRKPRDASPKRKAQFDEHGVPIVRDTRGEPDHDGPAKSNKRKADDGERNESPKKSKVEFKEDA